MSYDMGMKFLKNLIKNMPEQIISTTVGFGVLYIIWRGIVSIIKLPPSTMMMLIVLCVGIFFGFVASLTKTEKN
jgi:hypothetical protein